MNHQFSMKMRVFSMFLALQFLNVQIQSAFGTEAMIQASPEARAALEQLETKVLSKLANQSERQLNRIAYQLYKINIKLHNKTVRDDFTSTEWDQDEQDAVAVFQDQQSVQTGSPIPTEVKEKANREAILAQTKILSSSLGSEENEDGTLSKVSFKNFKENLSKMKSTELRGPAGVGKVILKIILVLLVLIFGYIIIVGTYIGLFLMIVSGLVIGSVANTIAIVVVAGVVVGLFFAIKAIVTEHHQRNKLGVIKS